MPKTFPRYNPLDEYPAADKNDLNTYVEAVIPETVGELVTGAGPGALPVRVPPGPGGMVLAMRPAADGLTWVAPAGQPINIQSAPYNCVGNGTTDNTTAMRQAFADADANNLPVLIPPGTFVTDTVDWKVQPILGVDAALSKLKGLPGKDVLHVNATVGQFYRQSGRLANLTIIVDDSIDAAASFPTRGGAGNAGIACDYNDAATANPYPPTLIDWSIEQVTIQSLSYLWGAQNNSCGIYEQSALFAQCAVRSLSLWRLSYGWWNHWPALNPSQHNLSHDHVTVHQIHFNGCKNNWRMCNWGFAKIDDVILHNAIGGTSWEIKGAQSGSNTVGNNHDLHISSVEMEGATTAGLVTDASCNNLFLQNITLSALPAPLVWNANASRVRNLGLNGLSGSLAPALIINGHRNEIELNGGNTGTATYGYDYVSDLGAGNRVTIVERVGSLSTFPRQAELSTRDGRTLHVRDNVSIQLGYADPLFVSGADLILNPRQFNPVAQAANTYTYVADSSADFGVVFRMLTAAATFNIDETVVAINGRNGGRIGAFLPPGRVRVYVKCKLATAGTMRVQLRSPINGTARGLVTATINSTYTILSFDADLTGRPLDEQIDVRFDSLAGGGVTPLDVAWIAFRPWALDWPVARDVPAANVGDADKTLAVTDAERQRWTSPLTVARTVTLPTTNVPPGLRFRLTRTAASTGAFTLTINPGALKALATGQWADVVYDGAAWYLAAFGSL